MPIELEKLAALIQPNNTVLFLGAGASVPSGAPTGDILKNEICKEFEVSDRFKLSEVATLIEGKGNRRNLITFIQTKLSKLEPNSGIRTIPSYDWRAIYTTNYDELIEKSYDILGRRLSVVSCNFDFSNNNADFDCKLYKLHGTIGKDISLGDHSRIIISENDYDHETKYREQLFNKLKSNAADSDVLIIGYSLEDEALRQIIKDAAKYLSEAYSGKKVYVLVYVKDDERAHLLERSNVTVAFGGIDEFFSIFGSLGKGLNINSKTDNAIDEYLSVRSSTIDFANSCSKTANFSAMFNGGPASYSEIREGLTFKRDISEQILEYLNKDSSVCAYIIGAAGVGKTTSARQVLALCLSGFDYVWEHNNNISFLSKDWIKIAENLTNTSKNGVLFVDEIHMHLAEVNELLDEILQKNFTGLKIIVATTRSQWGPRVKSSAFFKLGKEFKLSKLSKREIDSLLELVTTKPEVFKLVGKSFSGFSASEQKRRLNIRCEADMFVCLRNIFSTESLDDIILKEYADLETSAQEVYKYVAVMESFGVKVHRQLVIRTLNIDPNTIVSLLAHLSEIISEEVIDARDGIYSWHCRHNVIANIVAKHKFSNEELKLNLLEQIVDEINPAFEIEIRTIKQLCSPDNGIANFKSLETQNFLLRKLISNALGERVPRHRLIRNLIEQNAFDKANQEIKVFINDFNVDAPILRYKIKLKIANAVYGEGLMKEDRIAKLEDAYSIASRAVKKHPDNKSILSEFGLLGIEFYKITGKYNFFDEALKALKEAEMRTCDPDVTQIIKRFERQIVGKIVRNLDN